MPIFLNRNLCQFLCVYPNLVSVFIERCRLSQSRRAVALALRWLWSDAGLYFLWKIVAKKRNKGRQNKTEAGLVLQDPIKIKFYQERAPWNSLFLRIPLGKEAFPEQTVQDRGRKNSLQSSATTIKIKENKILGCVWSTIVSKLWKSPQALRITFGG